MRENETQPSIEDRIIAGIRERRGESFSVWTTPYVDPETLLGIARRAGAHIDDIGGASVRIYTVLGWLRIYENKGIGPDYVMFGREPEKTEPEPGRGDAERLLSRLDDIRDLLRVISRRS